MLHLDLIWKRFMASGGKDFIEVHHIRPLSTIEEEMVINPKEDLVSVCSNCHRMIHRRKDDVLTIEE